MKLYGKNPILERIKANPGSIHGLYLQKRTELSSIVKAAKSAGLNFESVEKEWMTKNYGSVHTQGVVAEVDDFTYYEFSFLADECEKSVSIPVFVDGVTDPQNLGGIIRTLACLGGFSVVIPEYESAEVNETVLRVANGGENYVKVARVTNLSPAIKKLKDKGMQIAGAVIDEKSTDIKEAKLELPLCLVVGSEGKGIRPGLIKHLDITLALPMEGAALSYNVNVATAILCYEVKRMIGAA